MESVKNEPPQAHAFHLALPDHFLDDDNKSLVTQFAARKSQEFCDLVFSIQLKESMYVDAELENDGTVQEEDDEEEEAEDGAPETLELMCKRVGRLTTLLNTLSNLKYWGISQDILMKIILHLFKLATATVSELNHTLYYDMVGTILTEGVPPENLDYPFCSPEQLEEDLQRRFALPSPTRETLLLVLIGLLSTKKTLRSVSNASLYPKKLLILHWKALFKMLLRTAPYLNEKHHSGPVRDSSSHTNTVLKRTVQMIRDARHFFDQGLLYSENDVTSKQVWDLVKDDILLHSHTHACYRASIILYLFQPSRCSKVYYQSVLPKFWEAWTNIDRCPEYDFLYLALFCRARKYVSDFDWGPIRKRLLTLSQYWLQLPIGGAALDKSFPRAPNPRSRTCLPRLKIFVGASSSYEEGMDFVAKVTKLLVTGLGSGSIRDQVSEGTQDVLRFLNFVAPYFNPSNVGQWTFTLGAFLHYFSYELSSRLGVQAANEYLKTCDPDRLRTLETVQPHMRSTIPAHEVVLLMDALLPLCQQALYSKSGHVARAGESALLSLVQIDPKHTTPTLIDFATSALDITSINLSHQAPAALSALTRLIQPSLRCDYAILFARLPEMLRLSLAGIDSNDQNKTIRTLIFYRSLASWVPVGGKPSEWKRTLPMEVDSAPMMEDGTLQVGKDLYNVVSAMAKSKSYLDAFENLPNGSLWKQSLSNDDFNRETRQLLLEEGSSAMSDWSIEFLERVFELLRASGEREKKAKGGGAASRHSSAEVFQARNFSRVLKETLVQIFSAMDDETHSVAVRTVSRFLEEETLPSAAKDSSLLCQAVAASRGLSEGSPGLDVLVPMLTDDLPGHSTKTINYRLRCLAGAVKSAGDSVVRYKESISKAIHHALSSDDKHLFKIGCKLLRHTLSTLVESYPLASNCYPSLFEDTDDICLGRSAQIHGDPVQWHVPDLESVEFACSLLDKHVVAELNELCHSKASQDARSKLFTSASINDVRRCLRVIRYAIRGGATLLMDNFEQPELRKDHNPYEMACCSLFKEISQNGQSIIRSLRGRLCSFMVVMTSVIASETMYPQGMGESPDLNPYRKAVTAISSDPKVSKETCTISLLLLTRRGSAFRSQEARSIWRAQKNLNSDYVLGSLVDHIGELYQSSNFGTHSLLYKDGENGGKTIPRRLLLARVLIYCDSLHRIASFEIPKQLRKHQRIIDTPQTRLFDIKRNLPEMIQNLERLLNSGPPGAYDAYEGLADGLYALSCHSNVQVRGSALNVIDYTMTRFGWLVALRVPRLLSGLSLQDGSMNGKFGIPSCAGLVEVFDQQGKRKKLAEAVKGVCSILALSRATKHLLRTSKIRHQFVKTVCDTEYLVSLLPAEEMQKVVVYLQRLFSPFRSKYFCLAKVSADERSFHRSTLEFALDILSESRKEVDGDEMGDNRAAVHWRKLLLSCWILMAMVDENDLFGTDALLSEKIWSTCCRLIETEGGQPLQRVAIGLFGRLVALGGITQVLRKKLVTESFCVSFGQALVYDHREDTSVGGGHDAQWSTGVEDFLRDATRNVAPRSLYPFQRTSQANASFKVSHAQLLESTLASLNAADATVAIRHFLKFAKDVALEPPSEDHRNQQVTSAEIFGGVCRSFVTRQSAYKSLSWNEDLLPHLDAVIAVVSFSLTGAYFDAIRYAIQFCNPGTFQPLTIWLVEKIVDTLWQATCSDTGVDSSSEAITASTGGTEGFTSQSKWLYLFTAVLIEMDDSEAGSDSLAPWFSTSLTNTVAIEDSTAATELEVSWKLVIEKLLPRLVTALGHPFDSCRDHISRCLFRICYCHRKIERASSRLSISAGRDANEDTGSVLIKRLTSLADVDSVSYTERYNALNTTRRFISYCVHLGEAKFEYSDYVIPLLSLGFESIKPIAEEVEDGTGDNGEASAAKRALEVEVVNGFRYMLADVSVTSVISYGNEIDIDRVLQAIDKARKHEHWQVRHAAMNFLRCFQGAHKFVFSSSNGARAMDIVAHVLADERREVSSAAMSALTGILTVSAEDDVSSMVDKYVLIARRSKKKRANKKGTAEAGAVVDDVEKEKKRAKNQKSSVFFLCAAILAQPYDTPTYVPTALAAISTHSFERNAPLGVRDTVKKCCAAYKRTHMSDNWELQKKKFSQEQLEALEDVVSTPHYYA